MSQSVIKIEGVGKQYRLGQVGTGTLAADLNRWWYRVRGKEDPYLKLGQVNDRTAKADGDLVWALKDITFDVKQGEVLGIIGKNGAGKSTLLKILSRVTSPSVGDIKVKGRIASLLEVGTGFHPDLTGRENVFLNGTILGMRKHEIQRKFDEIVSFSGVERYIDTPVKRYSSGMYVRLAFAVAAHLEPEILIVDEVLAVGDAEFQEKCLGKMKDVAGNGRTVLFVSHNMAAVKNLCQRAILLDKGRMSHDDVTEKVIRHYFSNGLEQNSFGQIPEGYPRNQYNKGFLAIESITLKDKTGSDTASLRYHEPVTAEITLHIDRPVSDGCLIVSFVNEDGDLISYSSTNESFAKTYLDLGAGKVLIRKEIQQSLLPGSYRINAALLDKRGYPYDSVLNFGKCTVSDVGLADEHYHWARPIGLVNFKSTSQIIKL
jgi:lipopolysaccharide transport system ATP-binding protein